MRLALILLAAPLLAAANTPERAPSAPCKVDYLAKGKPAKPQKLGELPPADAWAAVLRTDDKGCPDPLRYRDRAGLKR